MDLIKKLELDFENIKFVKGRNYIWSSQTQTIYYKLPLSKHALFHELGHATCQHFNYRLDIELIKLEVDAWEQAKLIAAKYNHKISQAYIDRNLETYRNWLLLRSKCPNCDLVSLQNDKNLEYNCFNCQLAWSVPHEVKCLIRRIKSKQNLIS